MSAFRRILVPHDFSKHANRALQMAAELLAPGGRLVVLHVVVPVLPVVDITAGTITSYLFPDEMVRDSKTHLARMIAQALSPKLRAQVDTKVIVGDPHQQILAEAARGANLIVMSTAGRTGFSHLLIGSVAEKVVRHSPVPVLTFRPGVARRRPKKSKR